MTKITVNGREIDADPKKPLIAACHSNHVEVPHYCYHPGLEPVGSCRICQVEVQQGTGPARVMVACRTFPAEGMVVQTESTKAHDTRRECLEFLLKNHPLDCPICDKAGECDLQDYTYSEGQGEGRTHEPRRKLEKRKSLGDVIVLDEERCILCSRCVRFFEEVTKKPQLTVADLGSRSTIATFADRPLTGNYQGNIADLCPVGALTLSKFRFQARVWNLVKMASTCAECSRGCSTTVEVLRGGEVKRFRPRENAEVNKWWLCDTGRFAFGPVNAKPRLDGSHNRASLAQLCNLLAQDAGALIVASPFCTQEEGAALLEFVRERGAKALFLSPAPNALKDDLLHTGDPCPNRRGLTELGFAPLAPSEIGSPRTLVLVGERSAELAGAALAMAQRVALFDTQASSAPNVALCIGVATHVEKSGTWINVDGKKGVLGAAKPPPNAVRPLPNLLTELAALLRAQPAPR
ncbi:MAG: (2Fe-2S)-binding protein [Planctomycetes bacterium]|nr:(2Fe-2S)-binding protein [Planctomycetota bacterium]